MFSFAKRKIAVDLCPYIRRICDLTTPNLPTAGSVTRSENRLNRSIPTLICPWVKSQPIVEESFTCLTSDLSDHGACLILSQPIQLEQIVLGFWVESADMREPWFFLAEARRCQPTGGGFWNLGVELLEFANDPYSEELSPLQGLAADLRPPAVPV